MSCQRVIDGRRVGRDVGMRCQVGTMSLATSCDIMRSGAGGVRRHSSEGVVEERRGGGSGSGRQAGVGSGSGRRVGVGSIRGSPYNNLQLQLVVMFSVGTRARWNKNRLDFVLALGLDFASTLSHWYCACVYLAIGSLVSFLCRLMFFWHAK